MSYASDHLAWQQRVNKEVGRSKYFYENYVPVVNDPESPLKGLVEKYSCQYSFADPNAIGKYDLKKTLNDMEIIQKGKTLKKELYRKS
jgi:hypothetical protein